jgi:hypothetical protein
MTGPLRPESAATDPRAVVMMAITNTPTTVNCDTCGMHMTTEGSPESPADQPFGVATDVTGATTDLADGADLLTHYANLVCTKETCPHRTPT